MLAPEPARSVDPDPNEPWRPREAKDGVLWITWSGESADRVRVKTDEFEWEGEDRGERGIPATAFDDIDDEGTVTSRANHLSPRSLSSAADQPAVRPGPA